MEERKMTVRREEKERGKKGEGREREREHKHKQLIATMEEALVVSSGQNIRLN